MPGETRTPMLGLGLGWRQMQQGQRWRTHGRTVTEHDLMAFIGLAGMQEPLFVDASRERGLGARPVPGALTYALIEGLTLKLVAGAGMAMLETRMAPRAPVRVGDTIHAECEVAAIRPTSKGNRAVVEFAVTVQNQRGEVVMDYSVKRMLAATAEEENA